MIGYLPPSRHRIHPFVLHRPERIDESAALLADLGDRVLPMAGGVDVVNWLKAGQRVAGIVDLQGVQQLQGITEDDGVLRVGALVTHREFEQDQRVEAAAPGLAAIWSQLGNVRIRMAGTLVGNLVSGAASYDAPPVLLALDAQAVLADGARVSLDQLPVRQPGQPHVLVTGIELPIWPSQRVAYNRELKPAVTVAVALRRDSTGFTARVAVGCALPGAAAATMDLGGATTTTDVVAAAEEGSRAAVAALPPFESDHRASAAYRRRVAPVLAARELRRLAKELEGTG